MEQPSTPAAHETTAAPVHFQNDGYFGPSSVSWRVYSHPSGSLAAPAAALLQMLLPPVVRVIDTASSFYKNPMGRAKLTAEYYLTAIYGDTFLADNASQSLWNIHRMKHAADPETGKQINATDPELLFWVHNTVVWCELRACERYGPTLTLEEQNQFVVEQHIMARLAHVDLTNIPATAAEVNAYVEGMTPKLKLTPEAERLRETLAPQHGSFNLESEISHFAANASVDLLSEVQQQLYNLHFSDLYRASLRTAFKVLFDIAAARETPEQTYTRIREYVASNPFGNRAVLVNHAHAQA